MAEKYCVFVILYDYRVVNNKINDEEMKQGNVA